MPDDLRTRIAAAVARELVQQARDCGEYQTRDCYKVADAVIAALGLEPQVHYDPDCEFYRYVTDWIDPQTSQKVDLP